MDREKQLESFKKLLRSLLLGYKGGIEAHKIFGAYKEITGDQVPYRMFGYSDVDSLFKALPDVVRISTDRTGEKKYVAVADDSTAHIERMVKAQKTVKKKSSRGRPSRNNMRRPMPQFNKRQYMPRKSPGFMVSQRRLPPNPYRNLPQAPYRGLPQAPYRNVLQDPFRSLPQDPYRNYPDYSSRSYTDYPDYPDYPMNQPRFQEREPMSEINNKPKVQSVVVVPPRRDFRYPESSYDTPPRLQKQTSKKSVYEQNSKISVTFKPSPEQPSKFPPRNMPPAKPQDAARPPEYRPQEIRGEPWKNTLYAYVQNYGTQKLIYNTTSAGKMGFVSSVRVFEEIYGSLTGFPTKQRAEQEAAKNACQALKVSLTDVGVKKKKSPQKGPNFNLMSFGEDEKDENSTNYDIEDVKAKVREIINQRPNGLWPSRLPVEYKEKFKINPPPNLSELLEGFSDILKIEKIEGINKTILYPVIGQNSTASLQQEKAVHRKIPQFIVPQAQAKFMVFVSHIKDPSQFFVNKASTAVQDVMNALAKSFDCPRASQPIQLKDPQPGTYCIAQFSEDGSWYRAQILSASDDSCEVFYVDFGNYEKIPTDKVRVIPGELCKEPAQAIKCQLHGIHPVGRAWGEDAIEEFKSLTGDIELVMVLEETKDDSCVVNLYNQDGNSVSKETINSTLVSKGLASTSREPNLLTLPQDSEWDVYVSYVNTATDIALRIVGPEYSDLLEELEDELLIVCGKRKKQEIKPTVGHVYIACSGKEDKTANRVRVLKLKGDEAECLFLDHADVDKVSCDNLFEIPPKLNTLPYQAVHCKLTGLENYEDNTKISQLLQSMALGKTCIAIVDDRTDKVAITLWDTNSDTDININEVVGEVLEIAELAPQLPSHGGTTEGYVSYVCEDGHIYFQIKGPGLEKLDHLMDACEVSMKQTASADLFVSDPKEGKLVLAKYSMNEEWYRAVIQKLLPGRKVEVFFVDFGNCDRLPISSLREIGKLNQKLLDLPWQGVKCSLDELPPEDGVWTPAALDKLDELVPSNELRTIEVWENKGTPVVQLYYIDEHNEMMSVSEILHQTPGIFRPEEENEKEEENAEENNQEYEQNKESPNHDENKLCDQLVKTSIEDKHESQKNPVAAGANNEKPTNGNRTPTNEDESKTQTNGNKTATNDNQNKTKTGQCQDLSHGDSVSSMIKSKNIPVAQIKEEAQAENGQGDNYCAVEYENYRDIPFPPKRTPLESGEKVYVTWVTDPHNFMCIQRRFLQSLTMLWEQMSVYYDLTDNAPSKIESGQLYAGRTDEGWKRVVVKVILGHEATVYSVDEGGFNVIPLEDLKELPAQFRKIPCLAFKCALEGVNANGPSWTPEAIKKFIDLVQSQIFLTWVFENPSIRDAVCVKLLYEDQEDSIDQDPYPHNILLQEGLAKKASGPTTFKTKSYRK